MQKLVDTYKHMQKHNSSFKIREAKRFSFGNFEDCKNMLLESLNVVDRTATIKWLPEYNEVAHWMSDNKGKGLLLSGDCGRGKSNIIMFALPLLFLHHFRTVVEPIHVQNLEKRIGEIDFIKRSVYAIDEVGAEPESNNYGVKYFPFMHLINEAEISLKICLFSSNLSSIEMLEKYDNRTLDRIVRLCKVVRFEGESLRK